MKRLRTQLSLTIALVVLITVTLISFLSNLLIHKQFEAYIVAQQNERITNIVENFSQQYNGLTNTWNLSTIHTLGMYSLYDGYIIKVYDNNNKDVWDSENHDMYLCRQVMEEISKRMKEYGSSGEFVSQKHSLMQNGHKIGAISIGYFGPYFLNERDFLFLDSLNLMLIVVGTLSLLLSFVISWLLARHIARPITKTADIAKQIAAGNYDIQFDSQTKTWELQNLVSSINDLADSLARQENIRKQLTADVAHELRTPLTMLGSHLELMIEKIWEPTPERLKSCHDEILRLGKLVADLERLERGDSDNLNFEKAPVDLLALAQNVCGNFENELSNKNLQLNIEGEISVVSIDRDRISGVITNLISNAVKYTQDGGKIHVLVQNSEHSCTLIIEDNGIGISEQDLPLIFERFYRADKSRFRGTGGAGIGLAVVKSVVSAHGGTVEVYSSLDHGSRFIITLPKDAK